VQNLGGKSPRLPPQHKYHSVFQTFPHHLLAKESYILKAIIEETTNSSFHCHSKANPQSILHSKVESWNARKVTNTVSSSILDDNIGEDGLSAQSMYEKNIDDSNYQNTLCPNQKQLHEVMPSHPSVKKIYVSVVRVINNLLMQISMNNTMTTNGEQGKSIKTNIAEVHASRVSCFPLDEIEFFEWTCTNKYGCSWYCPDISQSPILQRAIKKAIQKVRIMTHKAHCLTLRQLTLNKDVISLLDLLLHTERAMCWCHSTFTVLLFFILKKDLPPL
jgi:hypothetical protein